jgi:hypothetical protein
MVLPEKFAVTDPVKNFPFFMEPKDSLLCSQKPTFHPIMSQMNSVLTFASYVLKICLFYYATICV